MKYASNNYYYAYIHTDRHADRHADRHNSHYSTASIGLAWLGLAHVELSTCLPAYLPACPTMKNESNRINSLIMWSLESSILTYLPTYLPAILSFCLFPLSFCINAVSYFPTFILLLSLTHTLTLSVSVSLFSFFSYLFLKYFRSYPHYFRCYFLLYSTTFYPFHITFMLQQPYSSHTKPLKFHYFY